MWTRILVFCVALGLTSPAFATGGFNCSIDDGNLQFEASSAMGAGMGSPILNLQAHAKPKIKGTPNDFMELDLKTYLVHSWIDHPDFRLLFYFEREGETPHGTFELIIVTKAADDDISYDGDYRLTIFYTEAPADPVEGAYLKATGKVHCEIE
jgi:hypothetical protein